MDKNTKPSNWPTWVKYQAQFSTLQVREKYITLIAGALGFCGIAGAAAGMAKIVFYIFLVLLLVSLVSNLLKKA
mgnify:CR=1 FL=1